MKNSIILLSMLLLICISSSCENQELKDETGIEIDQSEIYEVDPEEIDRPGDQSRYN